MPDSEVNDNLIHLLSSLNGIREAMTSLQIGSLTRVSFKHLSEEEEIGAGHNMNESMKQYSESLLEACVACGNLCDDMEKLGIDLEPLKKIMEKKGV